MLTRRLHGYARDIIQTSARSNRQMIEPFVAALGTLSEAVEKKVREKLSLTPAFIEIKFSPSGSLISPPIRMNTCDGRDQISRAIYYRGWRGFEHPFPLLLEQVLKSAPAGLFFDIGANTGVYSLLSKAVCPLREVHAFEPFQSVLKILRNNIALNKIAADIIVVDAAASNEPGSADLFIPTQEHGLVETSASLSSNFKSLHSERVKVRCIKLDDYCHQLGLDRVAVMKIDVEGVEDKVFKGAQEMIVRDKPIIFCEILSAAKGWAEFSSILESAGYVVASIRLNTLVVNKKPDHTANNHIMFSTNMEAVVHNAARASGIEYRAA
jgi:FkbM family methyltransferase